MKKVWAKVFTTLRDDQGYIAAMKITGWKYDCEL